MNFVVDREDRAEILEGLLDAVGQLRWDIAHFNHLPEASSNASQLRQYTMRKAWLVKTHTIPCPRRSIPQSVDELMASLPSRLRTAIRSARRDLEKQHAVEFGLIQRKEEVGGALDALFRNHSGRWQAKGEEGVFVDLRKREFYRALSERLLEERSLRFFFLKADGRIVAQQFCFEYDGTVLLLQEGFDIGFSKLNVGNVLRAMVFEYLIEHGAKTYDFLGGMSRHKQSWSDVIANDFSIRACRPTLLGQAAHRAPQWLARLRGQVTATGQQT
ncbi:MAG: GNAT family N-acetyltransferase [Vicinamibacterales bacterium]